MESDIPSTAFSIQDDIVPFRLERLGNSNVANLIRITELDYDNGQSFFEFVVGCSDSSGSVADNITVSVLPENEHRPTYEITPPIIITETTPAGTVLASQGSDGLSVITVSDEDRGEDGRLTFTFAPTTDDAIENTHFSMNETDGTIMLKNTVDVDSDFRHSVTLSIRVCDGDRPAPQCTSKLVTIAVSSVNEFDPKFSQSSYPTTETVYSERDYSGLVIASVQCTDSDMNVGAFQSIQLVDDDTVPLSLTTLPDGQADVVLSGTLDYEVVRRPEVNIQLICLDNGVPARTDTTSVTLHIKDLDDNLPEFSNDTYSVHVEEAVPVNTEILRVQCVDADYGEGALVGVQIVNASSDVIDIFHIDKNSGVITLDQRLDYDSGPQSYKFTVSCTDSVGNEAVATVHVTVLGVNDEPVRFTKSEYHFTVSRLELPGDVVVGQLETEDRDIEPEQQITYSIEDNPNFDIDSKGQVLLQDFILFLEGDHFRLTVTASDGENDKVSSLVIVAVDGYLSVLDIVLIIAGGLVLALIILVACCSYYCFARRR